MMSPGESSIYYDIDFKLAARRGRQNECRCGGPAAGKLIFHLDRRYAVELGNSRIRSVLEGSPLDALNLSGRFY